MVSFVFYDLIFLAVFIVFVIVFLSTRKKNLKREGILYLYKTRLGIDFIDSFAKRFEKILKPLQYLVLISGYFLMGTIVWLIWKSTYLYLTTSISQVIKAPPVFPVIPYFPQIFGLQSLFPPLYFTYFIIALAIIAVSHEFAHGIFARLYNLKIESTGFAFLGPILGAFVEPDEKAMVKISRFKQMVILAAGTFANVIMALLFFGVLALFFTSAFTPAGVKFNNYAFNQVSLSNSEILPSGPVEGYYELISNGTRYFISNDSLKYSQDNKLDEAIVFEDTPAFRSQISGAITSIDGRPTRTFDELKEVLSMHNPGDSVKVETTITENGKVIETKEYEINLTANKEGGAALGIVFLSSSEKSVMKFAYDVFTKVKNPFIEYESKIGDFGWFVYYLLWWIVVLNFLVALFNMLPLGILDGGKFFYLTVWIVTGREKAGKWAYKIITWLILLLFLVMMIRWAVNFI